MLVEHDSEAVTAADQVVLMKEGRVAASGVARGVLSDPGLLVSCGVRPPQVAELFHRLGSSELPLTVEEGLALLQRSKRSVQRAEPTTPPPVHGPVIIQARGASSTYQEGGGPALRHLNLTVRAGEFVAVVGQNGSGKTTLGKLLSGLLRPSAGDVLLGGVGVASVGRGALARLVGYVFQNPDSQIFSPTVYSSIDRATRSSSPTACGPRRTTRRARSSCRTVPSRSTATPGMSSRARTSSRPRVSARRPSSE